MLHLGEIFGGGSFAKTLRKKLGWADKQEKGT